MPIPNRPLAALAMRCFAVLAAVTVLAGCESFFLPDSPSVDSRIVVDGAFSADSTWSIGLSRLRLLGEERSAPAPAGFTVEDAEVTVRPDGGTPIPLRHVGGGRYLGPKGVRPVPGTTYRLVADHPTLGRAEAVGRSPDGPEVEVGPARVVGTDDRTGTPFAEVQFTLRVRGAGSGASFAVSLSQVQPPYEGEIDRTARRRTVPFSSDDPDLRAYFFDIGPVRTYATLPEGAVLRTTVAEGEWREIVVTALTTQYPESGDDLFVRVTAIDVALRDHLYSRSLQEQYEGDPFANPAPLLSNVEGGLGVFGGYAQRTSTIPLPRP